jgi:pyruvate-ferredoxin/flavodoxin oxidoreductase
MLGYANDKKLDKSIEEAKFSSIVMKHINALNDETVTVQAKAELKEVLDLLPTSYLSTKAIFSGKERKEPGAGGIFSIFVSDLCKGCAACVEACGSHDALRMVPETEELHSEIKSWTKFLHLLPDTPQKYLGIYDSDHPEDSKAAALKNHLMQFSKYNALVSGDGACAGCGEKSVLRSASTLTEALMRPIFHRKADRLRKKADLLEENGVDILNTLKGKDAEAHKQFIKTVLHLYMGYGAEDADATDERILNEFTGGDEDIIKALVTGLRVDADKHDNAQAIEGWAPNGMSVMAMTAHTGCNSVYGSTPPNNPHPYPWMNSLFQDGATIGWLVSEGFMRDHALLSVIPERLTDSVLNQFPKSYDKKDFFNYTHFSDTYMTDDEVLETPKVWAIGGDGGMGDIGFQNVSKVVLQNRPNMMILLLDTQVYSNTGGQNSDSSPMPGGFDFNQLGAATEGKLTEMKSVAESFLGGHGSPFVARVSAANTGTMYKAILDGLTYRGTGFFQIYTTCQPEHGVSDRVSQVQAQAARDSRGLPEFVFDPTSGETYEEILSIKGNPNFKFDWFEKRHKATKNRFTYTVAHWALTEARFRRHHKKVKEEATADMIDLEKMIQLVTMDDITHRRIYNPDHRSFIPDFKVFLTDYNDEGAPVYYALSRHMVIFCVERRKAWRLLQSRAGITNEDYKEQKERLKKIDTGEMSRDEFLATTGDLISQ